MTKYTTIANLLKALNTAYNAAKKGLGLANKLGRNDIKSVIMSNMNRIRDELSKYSKIPLFTVAAYNGIIKAKIKSI